jgi:hypothetical protein
VSVFHAFVCTATILSLPAKYLFQSASNIRRRTYLSMCLDFLFGWVEKNIGKTKGPENDSGSDYMFHSRGVWVFPTTGPCPPTLLTQPLNDEHALNRGNGRESVQSCVCDKLPDNF